MDNPEKDADVLKDAQNIEASSRPGGVFSHGRPSVQPESLPPQQGGDIGWVHEGQLAPELNAALKKMAVNTVSHPIRSIGGYYILPLRARQEPLGTKIDTTKEAASARTACCRWRACCCRWAPAPPRRWWIAPGRLANQYSRQLSTAATGSPRCPSKLKGAVYMNLGNMRVGDLSPEIQKALASTHPGEMAQPFISDCGHRNDRALRQEDRDADRLCDADPPGQVEEECCSTSRFPPWRAAICATFEARAADVEVR